MEAASAVLSPRDQRAARIAGVLFLITFITSIAARLLYDPVQNDADFILGNGEDGGVRLAAFLEVLLIISNIGTAVVLFPVLRRWSETLALSYVTARVIESAFIAVGILSALAIVTLHDDPNGVETASLLGSRETLVAIQDWTFVLGPAFCAAIGNGMIVGYLMYRSGLVPRGMTYFGLIGGPVLFLAATFVLFGVIDLGDSVVGFATAPEFIWELSLGLYLAIKGFRAPDSSPASARGRAAP
jgi:hypothetical protein